MNFADKKKVMIAGGIAAVAVILLLVFVLKGGKKSGPGAGPGGGRGRGAAAGGGAQTPQTAGAPAPGQVGAGAAGGGAAAPAPAAGEQVAAATKLYGAVGIGTGEMSALTRPDPLITFDPPPPVITPEEKLPLPLVITVAGGLRPAGESAGITETIANRRVAGVKFNGGAWAILEKDGEKSFVVKPGDVIEGTKITAISRDSIYVTDPDGQPWQVPLRGAGPGGAMPVTTRRIPGLPESPAAD